MIKHGVVSTVISNGPITSNHTYKVFATLTNGDSVVVYAKPLDNQKIAKELLAFLIGRQIGIPIPEPCILTMASILLNEKEDITYTCYGSDAKNNSGFERFIHDEKSFEKFMADYNKSFDVAIFDEWLLNDDRNYGNILLDGAEIWFIDHEKILDESANISGLCRCNAVFDIIQRRYSNDEIQEKRDYYKNKMYPAISSMDLVKFLSICISENLIDDVIAKFIEEQLKVRVPYLSLIIDRRFCIDERSLGFEI